MSRLGKAAQYLLSLVNDILDVSKLQAGKVTLVHEPFDAIGMIENVCAMQREPVEVRGIRFERNCDGVSRPHLVGDEVRISQVLMNILSNAVKFTPEGGTITLTASEFVAASGREAQLTIAVADTGCGMTPEFQRQIFDVFTQERNSNSESQKGTGLGMSISYLLVQQMGGTLTVESTLGEGSCFTVKLPLPLDPARCDDTAAEGAAGQAAGEPSAEEAARAEAAGAAVAVGEAAAGGADADSANVRAVAAEGADATTGELAAAEASEPVASAPVEILVAEDNELNADIIASILTEEGFAVTVACNGAEAVAAFEASPTGHFAAIFMDAQMPVMDGYAAARAIRDLPRDDAGTVLIFACTASTFEEDRRRALDAGMDDFLPKPLNVGLMLQKLEAVRKGLS